MRTQTTRVLTALALAGGAMAGCGGDDSNGSSSGAAQGAPSNQQGAPAGVAEFQACLEKQGVEVPEPGSGGAPPSGGTNAKIRKAFEACQDKLPEGAGPGGGAPNFGQNGGVPGTQPQ